METIRKILAAACAILFVFSSVTALFAFNLQAKVFDSNTFKQAFEKENLYERMPAILGNVLYNSYSASASSDAYIQALTIDDWTGIVAALLPPQELKAVADKSLDSLFDYLNGRSDSVVITLSPLKATLSGPAGFEIAKRTLSAQPACTPDQLLQMGLGLTKGNVQLCNPPQEMLGLITPLIQVEAQAMSAAFPDEITLISSMSGTADPRQNLNRIRSFMVITPIFPVIFLALLTMIIVRTLRDWLKWWGWPFLITGGFSLIVALIGAPVIGWIVRHLLLGQGADFIPPILVPILSETVSAVTNQILKPVAIESSLLAIVGFGMVLVLLLLPRRNNMQL